MLRVFSILALAAVFFLAAALLPAQTGTSALPPMVAVLISPNLPAFASLPVKPSFTPQVHVFAQRSAVAYSYQLTVNYSDGDKQHTFVQVNGCECVVDQSDWRHVVQMGLRLKTVTSVTAALVTAGPPVTVTLSQ